MFVLRLDIGYLEHSSRISRISLFGSTRHSVVVLGLNIERPTAEAKQVAAQSRALCLDIALYSWVSYPFTRLALPTPPVSSRARTLGHRRRRSAPAPRRGCQRTAAPTRHPASPSRLSLLPAALALSLPSHLSPVVLLQVGEVGRSTAAGASESPSPSIGVSVIAAGPSIRSMFHVLFVMCNFSWLSFLWCVVPMMC